MNIVCLHLYEIPSKGKLIDTKHRIEVVRSWEEGEIREVLFNWYRVSAWYNENVLEIDSSHGHKSL